MELNNFSQFLIYDDGKIWSKFSNKFLKPYNNNGYSKVKLTNDEKIRKEYYIHRLIALSYLDNSENKPEVDHIDRNRSNNKLENLRWATLSENRKNTDLIKNTKTTHRNITLQNIGKYNYYTIRIMTNGIRIHKRLNINKYTLEDAINLRNEMLKI